MISSIPDAGLLEYRSSRGWNVIEARGGKGRYINSYKALRCVFWLKSSTDSIASTRKSKGSRRSGDDEWAVILP